MLNPLNLKISRQKAYFDPIVTNRYYLLNCSNGLLIPSNSFFSEIKPSPSHNIPLLSFTLDTLKLKRNQSLEHFALSDFTLLINVEAFYSGRSGDTTFIAHNRRVKSNRSVDVPLEAFWCILTCLQVWFSC